MAPAHFEDIQHPLHRDEVMRRLKAHIPGYDKGIDGTFASTRHNLDIAVQRAGRLAARSNAFVDTEPYTDVVHVVSLLKALGS